MDNIFEIDDYVIILSKIEYITNIKTVFVKDDPAFFICFQNNDLKIESDTLEELEEKREKLIQGLDNYYL